MICVRIACLIPTARRRDTTCGGGSRDADCFRSRKYPQTSLPSDHGPTGTDRICRLSLKTRVAAPATEVEWPSRRIVCSSRCFTGNGRLVWIPKPPTYSLTPLPRKDKLIRPESVLRLVATRKSSVSYVFDYFCSIINLSEGY